MGGGGDFGEQGPRGQSHEGSSGGLEGLVPLDHLKAIWVAGLLPGWCEFGHVAMGTQCDVGGR